MTDPLIASALDRIARAIEAQTDLTIRQLNDSREQANANHASYMEAIEGKQSREIDRLRAALERERVFVDDLARELAATRREVKP